MKIYNDLDLQGNRLLGVANMPNDLLDVKLLHADLTANPPLVPTYAETSQGSGVYEWTDIPEYGAVTPVGTENPSEEGWYTRSGSGTELDPYVYTLTTDTTVVEGTTYYRAQRVEKFAALCFAYRAADGSIIVTAVSIADFLQEAEFKDGLEVTSGGEVNVKIDPTSESYLTVSEDGVKLSGISSALSSLDIDHVTIPRDIYTYYNIGKITGASGTTPKKVASSGNTLKQLFDNLFNMDELQPSIVNNPSISIAIAQPSTANKLIGTHLSSVSYTITTYNGKSREMYDRQIDLITERLAPHMRRFARLLQKKYGLDEMTFADLKLSLDPDYDPRVTIPEAKDYVKKGLAVMGEDYVSMVEEAFDKRWIDFAKNQGKCTGGFCSSPYGRNSFILLSWNDRMSDVFTIAHELGHAGHFRHCNAKQSLSDTEVSTYLIEAPSTMNELLLAQYLLKTNDDPRFRRWVLSSMISNTYYHNFVTHLREAWYQREVYKLVDAGDSVNAEVLSDIFRKNLELFWGEGVKINDGAELTWMRQPHYYMGLYSYTYSAGLTVATEVARRIEREGQTAVDDWKKVLDAGSTLDPIGLAKLAGVDITTDAPLNDTIDYIGSIIDEICKLTEQIDGIKA